MDAPPNDELRARREAVVREHMDAEAAGDVEGVLRTFPRGAHYTFVAFEQELDGDEAVGGALRELMASFPDLTVEVTERHHAEAAVIVEGRMKGTNTGPWAGGAPTHRALDMGVVGIFRFDGADLLDETLYFDSGTLQRQIGPLPAPG